MATTVDDSLRMYGRDKRRNRNYKNKNSRLFVYWSECFLILNFSFLFLIISNCLADTFPVAPITLSGVGTDFFCYIVRQNLKSPYDESLSPFIDFDSAAGSYPERYGYHQTEKQRSPELRFPVAERRGEKQYVGYHTWCGVSRTARILGVGWQ